MLPRLVLADMLTRDEFQTLYDQGPDAVYALLVALQGQLDAVTARLQVLEARLQRTSQNSSQPPSSDGLRRGKPQPRSLRESTDRPSGGQPGHPGATLCQVAQPDHTVWHQPLVCTACGASLADATQQPAPQRRQVFDLPPCALEVTEHRLTACFCPHCQAPNRGQFPAAVSQPVQYGPRLLAQAVYLHQWQLLPLARSCEVLTGLFGQSLCEATLSRVLRACDTRLEPFTAALRQALADAPVAHFDETGVRCAGRLHWLHVVSTSSLTYFAPHPKRGRAAFAALGLLPEFDGVSVHDAWPAYFDPAYRCDHALCNAHLLRELQGGWEQWQRTWCQRLRTVLRGLQRAVRRAREAGQQALEPALLARYQRLYRQLIATGLRYHPRPPRTGRRGPPKRGPARCLLDRLQQHEAEILRFATDFRVPFDNNQAERDLRMVKVQQKVSGCFRTTAGGDRFCRLRSYLSTLHKQGYDLLDALTTLCAGELVWPSLQVAE